MCVRCWRASPRHGVALRAFDVTSDIGVPTVLCFYEAGEGDEIQPELGSGCHPDPMVPTLDRDAAGAD